MPELTTAERHAQLIAYGLEGSNATKSWAKERIVAAIKAAAAEAIKEHQQSTVVQDDHYGDAVPTDKPGLFDRFDDAARKVMADAQRQARLCNHEYIGTEHILLGMLREEGNIYNFGAVILKALGVGFVRIRSDVVGLIGIANGTVPDGKLPYTPRSFKIIELATEEADRLGHKFVGTEHLLLGMVIDRDGVAATVLSRLGVTADAVRGEIARHLATPTPQPPKPGQRVYRLANGLIASLGKIDVPDGFRYVDHIHNSTAEHTSFPDGTIINEIRDGVWIIAFLGLNREDETTFPSALAAAQYLDNNYIGRISR